MLIIIIEREILGNRNINLNLILISLECFLIAELYGICVTDG